eukprot:gene46496-56934_t
MTKGSLWGGPTTDGDISMATATSTAATPMTKEEKKVIFASSLGTVFEWYDFYLYGSLAAIIAKQFFSGLDAGVVSLFIQRRPASPVGPLSAATVADQQRVADAFFKLGLIPKPVKVADIVWRADPSRLALAGK